MEERRIAYFSMEIGLDVVIPTYSGGLGILAGDTIRSGADLKVPMVAVTLLHRKGYFFQRLDENGWQHEEPVDWVVEDFLQEMPERVAVQIEGRQVQLRAWKYDVTGYGGFIIPVYFLDANLEDNAEWDRALTHRLYGGDLYYRLCQEVILGIGGCRMLKALGYTEIERFHMNEGHASLLALELLDMQLAQDQQDKITDEVINAVREKCVFTTHTPVEAGHDKFPMDMVRKVLGDHPALELSGLLCCDGELNMTYLALNLSHYVNGVAKKHGEVSRLMFADYIIDSITNGVHAGTWVSWAFAELFDKYIPGWREDNFSLRYALNIPNNEIWDTHMKIKQNLFSWINRETNAGLDIDVLTLGFARRAASYKRADLMLSDIGRLKSMAGEAGALQILYAGKAHPNDQKGKELIQRIYKAREALLPEIKLVYLPNYDIKLGKMLTAGVDVWVNTPKPPMEASGTSGMKAALNGVPSLSILDGWWIEGCIEHITGWAIDEHTQADLTPRDDARDAESLYQKLAEKIIPLYYHDRRHFINVMSHSIALNGSFFNTQRMMQQYVLKAYF
ncbi:MAG: alpha-glucan family phosphorylase [Sedimentisphaerales bacterium]|nr:alpha-glucan family phosphorylase [Sedimentisphaerales bacterium]